MQPCYGEIEYMAGGIALRMTLVGVDDLRILGSDGLAGLRRTRLVRLASEAVAQGVLLGYEDLSRLLMTSSSTLKRDVSVIEAAGLSVPIKGRRRRVPLVAGEVAGSV